MLITPSFGFRRLRRTSVSRDPIRETHLSANDQKQVVIAANSGVDMIAPSAMVHGMVAAIRSALDAENYRRFLS